MVNGTSIPDGILDEPRRRDESIVSKAMMAQIVTMGLWLTALSFAYLKLDVFHGFFANEAQLMASYFVLFIASAILDGFELVIQDDDFARFFGRLCPAAHGKAHVSPL